MDKKRAKKRVDELRKEIERHNRLYYVDDNPVTPGKYGIKSIPTLIFFKDGKVEEQIVGIVAKSKLEEIIQRLI